MTTRTLQKNWNEVKSEVQSHWTRLTDTDLDDVNGDLDKLAAKIHERYRIGKAEVEKQLKQFVDRF